ncbi:MAG: hypothetical protein RLN85_20155, partial [Pseudomonadales bacterium]
LIATDRLALTPPDSSILRGISIPRKNASSSNEGKTKRLMGNRSANSELIIPGSNSPAAKPTGIATTRNNGTDAQARKGARKGDIRKPWTRLLRRYSVIG